MPHPSPQQISVLPHLSQLSLAWYVMQMVAHGLTAHGVTAHGLTAHGLIAHGLTAHGLTAGIG